MFMAMTPCGAGFPIPESGGNRDGEKGQCVYVVPGPLTSRKGSGSLPDPMASIAVVLQIIGLTLMPFALIVGMRAEHGMLAEMYLLGVGSALFFSGRFIGKRAASSS